MTKQTAHRRPWQAGRKFSRSTLIAQDQLNTRPLVTGPKLSQCTPSDRNDVRTNIISEHKYQPYLNSTS